MKGAERKERVSTIYVKRGQKGMAKVACGGIKKNITAAIWRPTENQHDLPTNRSILLRVRNHPTTKR